MKLLIKSAIATCFCLPMAFAECKDGCDCGKCKDKEKAELTEFGNCKEGCDCDKCKEKAKDKAELVDCGKCDKHDEEKEEGTVA